MSEELVREALRALRSADAGMDTGSEAEIRALLAFRRQQRRRRSQRLLGWTAVAAALVLAASASHWSVRETPHQVVAIEAPATAAIEAVTVPAPVPKPAESDEIATGFFPLMDNPPPFERGLLVRMTVPASTMRAVGLPVGDDHLSDPVQADVLVGQDDLARAIRFVSSHKVRD
jgi:hypothetical protein